MTALFKKLQLPPSLDEILILNEPEGFCKELDCLKAVSYTHLTLPTTSRV